MSHNVKVAQKRLKLKIIGLGNDEMPPCSVEDSLTLRSLDEKTNNQYECPLLWKNSLPCSPPESCHDSRIITCAVLPLEDMVKSRESFLSIVDNMQMYAPEIGRRYICHSL